MALSRCRRLKDIGISRPISERDFRYSTEAMILFSRFTEGVPEDTSELPSHDDIPMVVKHSFVGFSSVNHASIDYDIHSICSTL